MSQQEEQHSPSRGVAAESGFLRAVSVSPADRQPGRLSTALAGPADPPSCSTRRDAAHEKRRPGVSEIQEILTRFWDQLIAQPNGPLAFRLILQPAHGDYLGHPRRIKRCAGRPATLHVDHLDRSSAAGRLPSGRTEKSKQSHRLCACDGRDLSVPCFALVLPGRSAGHRVRACGSPLYC